MKNMMRTTVMVIMMLMLTIGIGYAAEYIQISKIEGIDPPLPPRAEKKAGPCSICWQVVYDPGRNVLRPQIFPANGGSESGITKEMVDSLKTIQPRVTSAADWQSFGFTCRPEGWIGFVDYAAAPKKMSSVPPVETPAAKPAPAPTPPVVAVDPNSALRADIEALKAKAANLEAAEAKRLKDAEDAAKNKAELDALRAKNAAKAIPAATVKKPKVVSSMAKELEECKQMVTDLNEKLSEAETSDKECQAALSTAQENNKKWREKYIDLQKKSDATDAELATAKSKLNEQPGIISVIIIGLIIFLAGMLIMYLIMNQQVKNREEKIKTLVKETDKGKHNTSSKTDQMDQ